MITEIYNCVTSFSSLVNVLLRRTLVLPVRYSSFTIDH